MVPANPPLERTVPAGTVLVGREPRVRRRGRSMASLAANMPDAQFDKLLSFLERLPAIDLPAGRKSIGRGVFENGNWWLKFSLDTNHPLAWGTCRSSASF